MKYAYAWFGIEKPDMPLLKSGEMDLDNLVEKYPEIGEFIERHSQMKGEITDYDEPQSLIRITLTKVPL